MAKDKHRETQKNDTKIAFFSGENQVLFSIKTQIKEKAKEPPPPKNKKN